jgi:hypothetical protein
VSARYRKDEQALVQSTRRTTLSPKERMGIGTTVSNLAALRFLP